MYYSLGGLHVSYIEILIMIIYYNIASSRFSRSTLNLFNKLELSVWNMYNHDICGETEYAFT